MVANNKKTNNNNNVSSQQQQQAAFLSPRSAAEHARRMNKNLPQSPSSKNLGVAAQKPTTTITTTTTTESDNNMKKSSRKVSLVALDAAEKLDLLMAQMREHEKNWEYKQAAAVRRK